MTDLPGKLPVPSVPSSSSVFPAPSTSQIKVDKNDPRATGHSMIFVQKEDGSVLKLWECSVCSRRFKHQYTLSRHIPVHTDERCFKCDSCPKAFRQLSTLTQHKVIHSNVRPFSCDICRKNFNRLSTLGSHRRTHFPDKKHVCATCGKGFHQKGNLRNHVFTHTNERPYKCDSCPKGFNQKSNLMFHKASAHSFTCEMCSLTFRKRQARDFHVAVVHGVITPWKLRTTRSKKSRPVTIPSVSYGYPVSVSNGYGNENNNNSTMNMNSQTLQVCSRFQPEANSYLPALRPVQTKQVFLVPVEDVKPHLFKQELVPEGPASELPLFNPHAFDKNPPIVGVVNNVGASISSKKSRRRLNIPSVENTFENEEKYGNLLNACPSVTVPSSQTSSDQPSLKSFMELKIPACFEPVTSPEIPPPAPEIPPFAPGSPEVVVERVPVKLAPPKESCRGARGAEAGGNLKQEPVVAGDADVELMQDTWLKDPFKFDPAQDLNAPSNYDFFDDFIDVTSF